MDKTMKSWTRTSEAN